MCLAIRNDYSRRRYRSATGGALSPDPDPDDLRCNSRYLLISGMRYPISNWEVLVTNRLSSAGRVKTGRLDGSNVHILLSRANTGSNPNIRRSGVLNAVYESIRNTGPLVAHPAPRCRCVACVDRRVHGRYGPSLHNDRDNHTALLHFGDRHERFETLVAAYGH